MANANILSILYSKNVSPLDFKFDSLIAPPLLSLLTMQDIVSLNQVAMSNKLASKPKEKYNIIDNILKPRGFWKIASGTNRVVYKYLEDQSICIKVAYDRVGIKDNPCEYVNQFKLKPFVTKMFEVTPCGTVGLAERVEPITTREEYLHIANDVYNLLVSKIIGRYVVDDIGSDYFQNIGIRKGFGPVLLDYPYVYELDGKKMYCNRFDKAIGKYCLGEIDYDAGFNKLICTKCGKEYQARQLGKQVEERNIIIKSEGDHNMSIRIMRGDEVVNLIETTAEVSSIKPASSNDQRQSKLKIWNKKNFDQRQKDKKERDEKKKELTRQIREKKKEKVQRRIENVSNIYHSDSSSEDNKPDDIHIVKEINIGEIARQYDPNFGESERFKRVQSPLKKPEAANPNSQNSNTSVADYNYNAGIKKPQDSDNNSTDDVAVSESTLSYDDPSTVEDTEEEVTEPSKEEMASSSWDNPVEVDSFAIEVDDEEDESSDTEDGNNTDDITGMY